MEIVKSKNSIDIANLTTREGVLYELLRYGAIKTECCMPGIVMQYNRTTHMAVVQPLVNVLYNDEDNVERAYKLDEITLPVMRIQHGGFLVDAPLFPGDTGWIFASDRNTDIVRQMNCGETTSSATGNKGPQNPNTYKLHSYENGFFMPDRWGSVNIESGDADKMIIRSMAANGTVIKLSPGGGVEISVGAGNSVAVTGNLSVSGSIASGGAISAATGITCSSGNIVAAGGDVIGTVGSGSSAKTISLNNHVHKDVNGNETAYPNRENAGEGIQILTTSGRLWAQEHMWTCVPSASRASVGQTVTFTVYYTAAFNGNQINYRGKVYEVIDGVRGDTAVDTPYTIYMTPILGYTGSYHPSAFNHVVPETASISYGITLLAS